MDILDAGRFFTFPFFACTALRKSSE